MKELIDNKILVEDLKTIILATKEQVAISVNSSLTLLYWNIGKKIEEDILKNSRANYGEQIVHSVSTQLTQEFGRGYSKRNVINMIRFYKIFNDEKIVHSLSTQLTWTHLKTLIYIEDELKRTFYIEMTKLDKWSTRTLNDRIDSMLYERTVLSKKPDELISYEIEKLKEGDTVGITNINNIITSAINDVKSFSITEADIEKVNAATDEFKEIDYFNDITPPSENITSVVIFNYYNSPSIQRINRVSETYSELISTLSKEKLHEFPKRLESFGKDIVEIEGLFKDLNNEAFKQNQEINNNLQEYFQLIKDVLKNLSLISTTVIKCIKLTETLIDSQYTLSNIICEQSDMILKIF